MSTNLRQTIESSIAKCELVDHTATLTVDTFVEETSSTEGVAVNAVATSRGLEITIAYNERVLFVGSAAKLEGALEALNSLSAIGRYVTAFPA